MGLLFDADAQMPNMAFDDFLKCFSKPAIMEAGKALKLLPRNTGKEMRTAIMAHVGADGRWVPEQAGFGPAIDEWKAELTAMVRNAERLASLRGGHEADDEEEGEFDHLLTVEEELYETGLEGPDEAETTSTETADADEAHVPEGQEEDSAEVKDALLEQAGRVLVPDDADPDARAAVKAHLDSHLEVVRIAA
jgi:hypothetical protein